MRRMIQERFFVWTALAALFCMAIGCASTAPVQEPHQVPAPVAEASDETPADQLPDNLDGFIITETPEMDEPDRRAFDEAVVLLNAQAYDQAVEILETIVAHAPRITAPYINLGIAYARTDKTDKAEAQFKKALELVPGHPVAGNEYGLILRKKGRFEEAQTVYAEVLAAYPNYYPVHRNMGILYDIYLGDLESAMTHYQIYIQAIAEDEKVKLWMVDLQARMGTK